MEEKRATLSSIDGEAFSDFRNRAVYVARTFDMGILGYDIKPEAGNAYELPADTQEEADSSGSFTCRLRKEITEDDGEAKLAFLEQAVPGLNIEA